MKPEIGAECQADKFEEVGVPQASMIPNMAENYRCMLVWDTRTNRDVGWLMVRKKAVNERKSEEVAAEMSQCQWRNWNLKRSKEEDEMCEDDHREILPDLEKGIEEASTSSESKRSVAVQQDVIVKVDFGVQVDTELMFQREVVGAKRSIAKISGEPLRKRTKLESSAVIESSYLDKLEVLNVFLNNNENFVKDDTVEAIITEDFDEEDISTVTSMRKPKLNRKISHSEELFDNEMLDNGSVLVSKGEKEKKARKNHPLILLDCPECGKSVKQKSFYMHLRVVHNTKSKMTFCNVCNKHILEVNLMMHRKTFHPDRFKFDLISCSGCQKQVRAVEFDGHECVVEEDTSTRPAVGDESNESSKCSRQDEMEETCGDCSVVFSGDEIRYHDCKISSVVRLNRLSIKSKKPVIDEVQTEKTGNLMCEDCGKLFNDNGGLDQHGCNGTFVKKQYCELKEDDVSLALDNVGGISESKSRSNVAGSVNSGKTKELKNVHSQANVNNGGSLSPANVMELKDSKDTILPPPAKIIDLSGSQTLAKVLLDSKSKIFESRISSTPAKIFKPRGERNLLKPAQIKMKVEGSLSPPVWTMDPRCSLTSAKVVVQPPKVLRRGKVFTFTVKLLELNKNSLQIQSACLTAARKGSSVLEFKLVLLQSDNSIILHPLWISICSADLPAVLLKCLIPCHTPCRILGKDELQFSMSCDLKPGSTECRYKLVVATKQLVLCYSREMIMQEPEHLQKTRLLEKK